MAVLAKVASGGKSEEPKSGIKDQVLRLMNEAYKDGRGPMEAAQAALDWLKRKSLAEALLAECGVRLLQHLYLDWVHESRARFRATALDISEQMAAEPGRTKGDPKIVKSLYPVFQIMEWVDGQRKAFGDCTPADLEWLADYRKRQGDADYQAADVYRAIKRGVVRAKATTVAEAYRHRIRDLVRLYRRLEEEA